MCFSSSPFPPALSTADLSPHLWTCFVCPALKTVKTNPKNSFQYSALKQFLCMCVCIFHTCMFHIVKEMLLIKRNSKARLKFTKKHSPRILWKLKVLEGLILVTPGIKTKTSYQQPNMVLVKCDGLGKKHGPWIHTQWFQRLVDSYS